VRYHPLTRDFFRTIFNNEGKCWPEFYKYIKRCKGYRENIPAMKDCNGRPIIHPIEKHILLIITILQYSAVRDFFRTIFNNEGKCWPEFYKYIKRCK